MNYDDLCEQLRISGLGEEKKKRIIKSAHVFCLNRITRTFIYSGIKQETSKATTKKKCAAHSRFDNVRNHIVEFVVTTSMRIKYVCVCG